MNPVFISYRRADTLATARRLHAELHRQPGQRSEIFLDERAIDAGVKFPKQIASKLNEMGAMVVLIGPDWCNPASATGRRLHQEHDYVRREIQRALARNVPLFPVLINGASMPKPSELPKSIQALCDYQALNYRSLGLRKCATELWKQIASNGVHITVKQSCRFVGKDRDKAKHHWWKWSVWIDGPAAQLRQVDSVTYYLHEDSFDDPIIDRYTRATGFKLKNEGYDDFRIKVILHRRDNTHPVIYHDLYLD